MIRLCKFGLAVLLSLGIVVSHAQPQALSLQQLEALLGFQLDPPLRGEMIGVLEDFNAATDHRALAAAIGADGQMSIGYAFAKTEIGASATARQQCEREKTTRQSITAPCEVVVLNDDGIPTAVAFKAELSGRDPAFVWRVTAGERTIYLGGTLHAMKPSFYPLNEAFEQAFASADRVAFELNPLLATAPDRVALLQRFVPADEAEMRALLPADVIDQLNEFSQDYGMPPGALLRMQPGMVSSSITIFKMGALGFDASAGLEMHYAQRASAAGKPVIELETMEDQLALLAGSELPVQVSMLATTLEEMDEAHQLTERLVRAWLAGDAEALYSQTLASMEEDPQMADFNRRMLDERNVGMAQKVEALLAGEGTAFVMVGAAHYGGPKGILQLLRDRGLKPVQLGRDGRPL